MRNSAYKYMLIAQMMAAMSDVRDVPNSTFIPPRSYGGSYKLGRKKKKLPEQKAYRKKKNRLQRQGRKLNHGKK